MICILRKEKTEFYYEAAKRLAQFEEEIERNNISMPWQKLTISDMIVCGN